MDFDYNYNNYFYYASYYYKKLEQLKNFAKLIKKFDKFRQKLRFKQIILISNKIKASYGKDRGI